jgi:GntR family transcriptional regulator
MKNLNIPLYFQVYESIKEKIQSGELKELDKLPSERKLCNDYNVSRITIREALELLEAERYIRREHGKGSYVLGNQYNQMLDNLYSFKDEIVKKGDKPSTIMLGIERISTTPALQSKMGLEEYQEVYALQRLRLANDRPLMYEVSYLPVRFCEGLDRFDFNEVSLYETLHKHYGLQIVHAYENLSATNISKEQAQHLDTPAGESCMFLERYSYIEDDNIIEYTETIVKGRDYKYTVKLI